MHNIARGKHPLGLFLGSGEQTCGSCAWSKEKGPGPKVLRCIAANSRRVQEDWQACSNWEESLDCLKCAACCGPAYDVVEISVRDPVRKKRPEWVVNVDGRYQMKRRSDNHCQALRTDNKCKIYQQRPSCCRDFEIGSDNCLFARRRLGFTRRWVSL
jgi:hypothetical protein